MSAEQFSYKCRKCGGRVIGVSRTTGSVRDLVCSVCGELLRPEQEEELDKE